MPRGAEPEGEILSDTSRQGLCSAGTKVAGASTAPSVPALCQYDQTQRGIRNNADSEERNATHCGGTHDKTRLQDI